MRTLYGTLKSSIDMKEKWGNTVPQKGDWIIWDKPTLVDDYVMSYLDSNLDLFPIPLTPEVIGRTGEASPVEHSEIPCWEIETGTLCIMWDNAGTHYDYGENMDGITHLHHLQQLYRLLTGKELTINWE